MARQDLVFEDLVFEDLVFEDLVFEDLVFEDLVLIRSMWRLLSCTVISSPAQ
jgi:hypothetical protein